MAGGVLRGKAFLFTAAVVLLCLSAVTEETPRLEVKATIGFGGTYKVNQWTPLRVVITNPDGYKGPVTVRVDMESGCPSAPHGRVARRYSRDLVLDGAPETRTIIAVRDSYATNKCWINLLDGRAGGGVAPRQQMDSSCATGQCPIVRPTDRPRAERVIRAVSLTDLLMQEKYTYRVDFAAVNPSPALKEIIAVSTLVKSRERDSKGREMAADELVEDAALYQCVDALIVDGVGGAALSPAHGLALRDWVQSGGTLVLTRACMESPWGGELLRLFPARIGIAGPAAPVDWKPASAFFMGKPADADPMDVLPLDLDPTFTAIRAGGVPVFASRMFGLGTLVLVPFDTADVRAHSAADRRMQERVWSRALEKASMGVGRWMQPQPLVPKSASIRRLALPYAGFVLLSALCLGPLCMLVVRSRERRIHVLWLLPAMSALLCALAFGAAVHFRTATAHVESVTLLVGDANSDRGYARESTGVISGTSGTYALGPLPPGSSVKESFEGSSGEMGEVGLFPPEVAQGNGIAVDRLHMNRWAMRFFLIEHTVQMPKLSGSLKFEDNSLKGWVQNDSGKEIGNAFLLFKWNRQPLGALPPGRRVELNLPLAPPPVTVRVFNPYYASYDAVSSPLNRVHWPDIPLDEGLVDIMRPNMACDPPTILAVLPGQECRGAGLIGGQYYSEARRAVGLWRMAVETTVPRPAQLPASLSLAHAAYNGMWVYSDSVAKWSSANEFDFPPMEDLFACPEVVLQTRLTAKSAKEMKPEDEMKARFFDWVEGVWTPDMKIAPGEAVIPNSARFVRPGDNTVMIHLTLAGPRAEKYERVELDQMEVSVREAKP
jgi:hypothetical protein